MSILQTLCSWVHCSMVTIYSDTLHWSDITTFFLPLYWPWPYYRIWLEFFFSWCMDFWHKDNTNFISSGSKIVKRLWRRQYDPVIIERTIGRVLGPFTALYRSFLKRCTLTNKAIGTIWRALSKPPQRRQGPDPRPLSLLVGTPSASGPELTYRLRAAQPTLMDVPIYFWYTILLNMLVYHIFMTSPLWLAVGPQSL